MSNMTHFRQPECPYCADIRAQLLALKVEVHRHIEARNRALASAKWWENQAKAGKTLEEPSKT